MAAPYFREENRLFGKTQPPIACQGHTGVLLKDSRYEVKKKKIIC